MDTSQRPDYLAFSSEVTGGAFLAGVAEGRWSVVSIEWPTVVFRLSAATRSGAPDYYDFKTDLTNFPADAPTATPWDSDAGRPLESDRRPRGGRADTVFRRDAWENGLALYAPWDRIALAGHDNWRHQHPQLVWHSERPLAFFLERTLELFNCDSYVGI